MRTDYKRDLSEFELKMLETYPEWFEGLKQSPSESCLSWGFEIGEGWHPLIEKLCADIKSVLKEDDMFRVEQVKEKFGTLRFYYSGSTNTDVRELVWEAEEKTGKICEVCGKAGKTRGKGWLTTLCKQHFQERQEKYK